MDNSGDRVTVQVTPKGMEALLRSHDLFTMVGCPDWCSWQVHAPGHEHVTDGVAELVLLDGDGQDFPTVLEARHHAVLASPTPARDRAPAAPSGALLTPAIDSWQEQRRSRGFA